MKTSIILLLLIACKVSYGVNIQGCSFCYTVQPYSESLGCNPYKNIPTRCTIIGPGSTDLQIKWFYSSTSQNGVTQEIGNNQSSVINGYSIQQTHAVVGINVEIQSELVLHSISTGHYWCQVFHGNIGLLASPRLEIVEEDDRLDPCSSTSLYETGLEKCDNIVENGASYSICPIASSSTVSANTQYISLSHQSQVSSCLSSSIEFTPILSKVDTSSFLLLPTEMLTTSFQVIPLESGQPFDLSTRRDSFHLWLYIVAALTGVFAILIIILTGICIGLCATKPNKKHTIMTTGQVQQVPSSRSESEEFNHSLSRTQTAMTIQTEIPMTPLPPELDSTSAYYDALESEQDYEDLDETDKHFVSPELATEQTMLPRYHEQGPSVATLSHPPLQPTYSEIGEATADTLSKHTFGMNTNSSTGYGKLDHSRPRQNYYPKRDSPLLSGYRKLEHIQAESKATTLPHNPQFGYANIQIPGATGGHLRSISLPNSEYSNLNPCPYDSGTEPNTPSHEQQLIKKKYANFDIIEAHMCLEELDDSPHMSQNSDDYHMLSDATAEHHLQGEYEFLPNFTDEQSPDELQLNVKNRSTHHRNVLASFCKDPLGEQMSVASCQSSTDFTGPFFFPHMVDLKSEPDCHIYKPLDLSKMEPERSYTMVKVKK